MQNRFVHIYHSPIGAIKLISSDHCIQQLTFIDTADIEISDTIQNMPAVMHQCMDELIEYFAGKRRNFTVAIDQDGTDFQQKVWKELYELPFGKTLSYSDLAKKMGDPNLVRAAASANAKNKVAIIIPCHRIIGSDRSLVGYAWGKTRKKWLLQHEFRLALGVQTLF
ncbi:MAG: methylated-DNA--[protein]-cysteine S-methyltransferase [Sediminibacterium sp.]|jgi:methylated-DNA-[protein]-cysteine S-methyltransferase